MSGSLPPAAQRPRVRLYLDQAFGQGQHLEVSQDQAHYLGSVLRLSPGTAVAVFNGRQGEWRADIADLGRRGGSLICAAQMAPQVDPCDLWLLFAPVKQARTDFIVEKGVELGAARLRPVLTDFTNAERVRTDRLQAHAVEAAEQCGATHVPAVDDPARLDRLLADWPAGRALIWADEGAAGQATIGAALPPAPVGILIGPEGGFSPSERARLAALPFVHRVALGPRILRAETAAAAALVLWQASRGDWAAPPHGAV